MRHLLLKTYNSISILNFGDAKLELSTSKIQKSAPQNLKFDFDFEFWGQKFDLENPKSICPIPLESCFET